MLMTQVINWNTKLQEPHLDPLLEPHDSQFRMSSFKSGGN